MLLTVGESGELLVASLLTLSSNKFSEADEIGELQRLSYFWVEFLNAYPVCFMACPCLGGGFHRERLGGGAEVVEED